MNLRIIICTVVFAAAGFVAKAQVSPVEKAFGGRSVDDTEITRKYITPWRLITLPQGLDAGVTNPEALLKDFDGQLTTTTGDFCLLSSIGGAAASVLLDFGKEVYGGIQIAAPMRPQQRPVRVRMRLGESVSEAMSDAEACSETSGDLPPMCSATNEHTLRDFTLEVPWLGTIEVGDSGFRFVRIDLLDQDAVLPIKSVRAILKYRDIPYLGSFESDDERLNRIWETSAYTVHLNMQGYLWDGIKRDRLVWLGDMHPEVMTIMSVFGDNEVVRKSLDLARDTTPLPGWMNTISAYSMWWVLIHRDLYLYRGDMEYLREQREYMRGLLELFIENIEGNREDLRNGFRLLDWPTSRDPEVIHAGYQALLVMTMEAGAQIGVWLGDRGMERMCNSAVKRLRKHVPPHKGVKQSASLLSLAGMIDARRAAEEVVAKGGPEGFSTFYGYYMLESLAKAGMYVEAIEIISQYWGAMLDLGATTFWENLDWKSGTRAARIDEIVPEGSFDIHAEDGDFCYVGLRHSLCHGWASGPAPWLSRYVLGVAPLEPACKTVGIEPHLGHLKWVKGTFPTPYGVICIEHTRQPDGKVVAKIDAPEGVAVITKQSDLRCRN